MVKVLQVALAAGATRLSAGFTSEAQNIPYRQLVFTATGADAVIGSDPGVTAGTGLKIAMAATVPLSLGPFETGPLKLSDLYALGAGSTLTILGVPF